MGAKAVALNIKAAVPTSLELIEFVAQIEAESRVPRGASNDCRLYA